MKLAALLLALSLPASAQQVVDVQTARLVDDVGRSHSVHGGYWLDDVQGERVARELVRLQAENDVLRSQPAPSWPWWVAFGVGLAGGVALGVSLGR